MFGLKSPPAGAAHVPAWFTEAHRAECEVDAIRVDLMADQLANLVDQARRGMLASGEVRNALMLMVGSFDREVLGYPS